MHVISNPSPLNLGAQGIFPAGRLIVEDKTAAELMLMFPDHGLSLEPFRAEDPWLVDSNLTIVAGGLGFGDAIMLTPVLRQMKKMNPEQVIKVACFEHFRPALFNLPYVDGFVDWPLPVEEAEGARVMFIEGFDRNYTHHTTLALGAACCIGFDFEGDKKPDYKPTGDEILTAIAKFPRVPGRKRLGIQVQASHRCRTYKVSQILDLVNLLIPEGWEVYLMGAPGEFAVKEKASMHLYDSRTLAPSFRESCAFLTTCDVFLGPDSGFLHAAGAMDIPAVGLFAVYPWQLRTAYYKSVFAIQAGMTCGPCFHSPTKLQAMFPRAHCQQAGFCTALADIEPERIKAKLLQVAR